MQCVVFIKTNLVFNKGVGFYAPMLGCMSKLAHLSKKTLQRLSIFGKKTGTIAKPSLRLGINTGSFNVLTQ